MQVSDQELMNRWAATEDRLALDAAKREQEAMDEIARWEREQNDVTKRIDDFVIAREIPDTDTMAEDPKTGQPERNGILYLAASEDGSVAASPVRTTIRTSLEEACALAAKAERELTGNWDVIVARQLSKVEARRVYTMEPTPRSTMGLER